ncbi:MAG: hypothetical protein A3F54_02070 [Candidatus Kerfeldbacteria bacterium RIFCSPHIGHO2_12_FULL_48_17]|uniref:Uncharacterized protein n=1 Tax=Candidatus Kerfeldbacteria bacterium RIFCSPHIGHO2_12_FULL_48_17 TaxID=1798542 RepID=A0A1G2AWU2_9BACT|nr:MAG: hypothetical protein A3F54_02070 [Candidatus Kerfeldbacteria bacterium RIFCSPHIGHO2_12_FULL_48_17]
MKNDTLQNIQRRFYITLAVWAGIVLIILGFFVAPSFFTLKNLRNETHTLEEAARAAAQQQADLIALSRNVQDIDTKITYVEKFFLNETSLLPFIQELENLAQTSRITLNISVSDDDGQPTGFAEQTFSLSLNGEWDDMLALVHDMEQTYPQMDIHSLTVSPNDSSSNSITVTVSAGMPTLYQNQNP